MGKEVPAEAVNEMLANFVLPKSKDMPGTDEYFDQVITLKMCFFNIILKSCSKLASNLSSSNQSFASSTVVNWTAT
ncbi:hypothetical protein Ccrd_024203 [Cynara cardunculus var. scolymus]|uniref:Uncharacterized protein n=1 Tax=Cynara cardunculus var. scolymus TaxID=59895 RepID=A0A118DD15_CYNCS|nr:hypothetical protein Ccrd_024203 [Cynara cardunculus var. scolymus]